MKRLLQNSGFEVMYSTYIFSILPVPIFLFRTIPSILKIHKKSNDVNKHKKEHSQKKGLVTFVLNKIWLNEVKKIRKKKRIPFGGSCLIVARKNNSASTAKGSKNI